MYERTLHPPSRRQDASFISAILALGSMLFSGCTLITDAVTEGQIKCAGRADGARCGNELDDGVERVCVAGACVPRGCGDGFVDVSEICDDGNQLAGDGCDPQSCTWSCESHADCDDGGACNGVESCDTARHTCVAGSPVQCLTVDACHVSACDLLTGQCATTLIDGDHDGHAPTSLGACGTDCNDGDGEINPAYPEVCGDDKDNNCVNGQSDETIVTWYADCDGDSYAATGATTRIACAKPSTTAASTGCPNDSGNWTTRNPNTPATADCADAAPGAHPDATGYEIEFQGEPVPGVGGYDWNCANGWEQNYGDGGLSCFAFPNCQQFSCCWIGSGQWRDVSWVGCGDWSWIEYCGSDRANGGYCNDDEWIQQKCR